VRVVSLLPSATEIVHAVGMGAAQVGRSHACDHPPEVMELPVCTQPRCDSGGRGSTVDERIRWLVRNGLSVYQVDEDTLGALEPDVIVTQDQCAVCAATPADLAHAVRELLDPAPTVLTLEGKDLEGVWRDIRRVGRALGASAKATDVVATARDRVRTIEGRTATSTLRPRVVLIEWIEPLMAAGNWMPELIRLAGGDPMFGQPGVHSPWLDRTDIEAADPDIVVLIPCGYTLEETMAEADPLLWEPWFTRLRAVRAGQLFAADGRAFFNRPGPRLVESLEILVEILHPELLPPSEDGRAWVRLKRA